MEWISVVVVVLCLVLGLVMEFCHLITILDFLAFGGTSNDGGRGFMMGRGLIFRD